MIGAPGGTKLKEYHHQRWPSGERNTRARFLERRFPERNTRARFHSDTYERVKAKEITSERQGRRTLGEIGEAATGDS